MFIWVICKWCNIVYVRYQTPSYVIISCMMIDLRDPTEQVTTANALSIDHALSFITHQLGNYLVLSIWTPIQCSSLIVSPSHVHCARGGSSDIWPRCTADRHLVRMCLTSIDGHLDCPSRHNVSTAQHEHNWHKHDAARQPFVSCIVPACRAGGTTRAWGPFLVPCQHDGMTTTQRVVRDMLTRCAGGNEEEGWRMPRRKKGIGGRQRWCMEWPGWRRRGQRRGAAPPPRHGGQTTNPFVGASLTLADRSLRLHAQGGRGGAIVVVS